MLAYLSWHRAAPEVEPVAYEHALERFHRSLAHRPPSGFRSSATFRVPELPWLPHDGSSQPAADGGYEDWYVVDDWAAIGVLEEAAVSQGHISAHQAVAALAGPAAGAAYRLIEGNGRPQGARVAAWVARPHGHGDPSLAALLGDGMDPLVGGVWRRCLGLGPAPEFCVLGPEAAAGRGSEPPARGLDGDELCQGAALARLSARARTRPLHSRLLVATGAWVESTTGKRRACKPRAWAPSDIESPRGPTERGAPHDAEPPDSRDTPVHPR